MRAFNDYDDEGRQTTVMLHLQHAFEMLLKGALRERNVQVFSKSSGRSIGFDKCLRLASEHLSLGDPAIGTLRAIDALRDDEMHYLATISEGILFLHTRAAVTLFDEILFDVFNEHLADNLPERVLPISTRPTVNFDTLMDEQYSQITDLLQPRRRRRPEARSRIRCLLAMEGHVTDAARVSERDVDRVEAGVRDGKTLKDVFPRLGDVEATFEGEGPTVKVHFAKRDGAPVKFVSADDPTDAAAVREIDLQRKFHISRAELARHLTLSVPRAAALRTHLALDDDESMHHTFTFASQRHHRYSDNALRAMREAAATLDMDKIWADYKQA